MRITASHTHEQFAADAFSLQSGIFDRIYAGNAIIDYKRQRVREHTLQYLPQESSILELNSGTGDDAIFFAAKGHHIHATDISEGMQLILKQKVTERGFQNKISTELCSFTQLDQLQNKGPYDLIFSNFGGLNCTGDLDKVLDSLEGLVKPGGQITLVIISTFCLWETLLLFKGKFKTATRRFFSVKGRKANIEGTSFTCWYYDAGYIQQKMKKRFDVIGVEGLCSIVPPSYIEGFAEKHPKIFSLLIRLENKLKELWPIRSCGDYFIISLRRKLL